MICRDTATHEWVCGWLGGSMGQWEGSGQITNNLINLDIIKILRFCFEDLWFVETPHPSVGVWVVGWVSGSMGGVRSNHQQFNKSWHNRDNSILLEDLWFVETPHPSVGVWVVGWVSGSMGGSGQMTNNWINLDLIKIIQFCVKIYDL